MKLNRLLLLYLLCFSTAAFGQIGIGTDNPDTNSVLHLESSTKGLIIPKMSTALMQALQTKNPQTGTLVFNTDSNEIYSYDASAGQWYCLTPLVKQLYPGSGSRQGIRMNKNAKVDRLDVTAGYGITPIGGIIMWSGSIATIPDGWALCDGNNGTPNLKDKFVVGAGNQYNVNATGGANSVTLSLSEIPSHNHQGTTHDAGNHVHNYNDRYEFDNNIVTGPWLEYYVPASQRSNNNGSNGDSDNDSFFYLIDQTQTSGNHNHSIKLEGGGQAHENRPPYYALAYIMRIK